MRAHIHYGNCGVINVSSLCHQEFWVHRMVELLPSAPATGQRTPAHRKKERESECRTPALSLYPVVLGQRTWIRTCSGEAGSEEKRWIIQNIPNISDREETVGKNHHIPQRTNKLPGTDICTKSIRAEIMPDRMISLLDELLSICEITWSLGYPRAGVQVTSKMVHTFMFCCHKVNSFQHTSSKLSDYFCLLWSAAFMESSVATKQPSVQADNMCLFSDGRC